MNRRVIIDSFPESAKKYGEGYAVVAVDVIRATTSAVTVAAMGRRCFAVASLEAAFDLALGMDNPLLVGELGGDMPPGFHMNNSPADLQQRTDTERPIILLSTSGTRLIDEARHADAVFLACFRNVFATADYLAPRYESIALIGAGSRGEFREEDQMGCAWIADRLMHSGFRPADFQTASIVESWRGAPPSACAWGNSAKYLRRSGQVRDLDFIISHINDVPSAVVMSGNEVIIAPEPARAQLLPSSITQHQADLPTCGD